MPQLATQDKAYSEEIWGIQDKGGIRLVLVFYLDEMEALLRKKKMDEMQLVTVEEEKKWDAKQSDYGLLKFF